MQGRFWAALARAGVVFLRSVWRIARQLFHEATGSVFFLFALVASYTAWREWHRGAADWRVAVTVGFAFMMAAFGVSSFRSARRVR